MYKPATEIKLPSIRRLDLIKGSHAIAKELGCDQATALRLIHEDGLPAFRLGNAWVVRRETLHAWIQLKELQALVRRP